MTVISEEKPERQKLSARQKAGIRTCMAGLIGVLVLFIVITAIGSPIPLLGTIRNTLIYEIIVYTPVLIVVGFVFKRLK
jgi:hypothetical protein